MLITYGQLKQIILEALDPDACPDCMGSGKAYVGFSGRDEGKPCSTCGGGGKRKKNDDDETFPTHSTFTLKDWVERENRKLPHRSSHVFQYVENYRDKDSGMTFESAILSPSGFPIAAIDPMKYIIAYLPVDGEYRIISNEDLENLSGKDYVF